MRITLCDACKVPIKSEFSQSFADRTQELSDPDNILPGYDYCRRCFPEAKKLLDEAKEAHAKTSFQFKQKVKAHFEKIEREGHVESNNRKET